jgi:GNAT superfamily N-acetyltransferase
VILTQELDATIVRCEIAGIRSGIDAAQRLSPESDFGSIEVAGGLVAFTGVESPLSQAVGIGAFEPVTEDDVARITAFYESRGATPRVFVTPLADSSLGTLLPAAGYTPCEYENVLASDSFEAHALHDDRIGVTVDAREWARASAQAFTGRDVLEPKDEAIALLIATSDEVIALEAREDGAIVATSAMDVRGECAGLFAGSTMPDFRGRGWHVAMIRERIARARDAGVRFLRATARPGSPSERNFVRCGFTPLYTRVLWERPPSRANRGSCC